MEKKRIAGLDAVRVCASAFVIILHAVSLLGAMNNDILSAKWFCALFLRELSYTCVPLFIILSGYLLKNKKPCISYYKGIIPLYISYALISVFTLAAAALYTKDYSQLDPMNVIYRILNFSANDYSWYFEMYIGLFIAAPFLNIMYRASESRKVKLILIFSLMFLTLLPDTIIGFSPYYDGSGTGAALNILPDFFKQIYPFTYYIIGCYLAEYKPYINKKTRLPLVIAAVLIPLSVTVLYTYARGEYAWYMFNGFQNICVCLSAIAVFVSLYDLEINSAAACFILKHISLCSFEIYLFSYVWDCYIYRLSLLPDIIKPLAVFSLSLISALLLRLASASVGKLLSRIFPRTDSGTA